MSRWVVPKEESVQKILDGLTSGQRRIFDSMPENEQRAYLLLKHNWEEQRGKSWNTQELQTFWQGEGLSTDYDPERVQTASLEPVLSHNGYWLQTSEQDGFSPSRTETIEQSIARLKPWNRYQANLRKGQVIVPDQRWYVQLAEDVVLPEGVRIRNSPKSSTGRDFLNTRLIADFQQHYDGVYAADVPIGTPRSLWLEIEAQDFSFILREDQVLNQLRFLEGDDPELSDAELKMLINEYNVPLLSNPNDPLYTPHIADGGEVTFDIKGRDAHGIVGLLAKRHPRPIDLSKVRKYDVREYFKAQRPANGVASLGPSQLGLYVTRETVYCPPFLCAEVTQHAESSFAGPKHFAGFIDNGFKRPLVLEARSDETDFVRITDGRPAARIRYYWTDLAETQYDTQQSVHYNAQSGPTPSKRFKLFNWYDLAA